ncbi:flagellar hook-associated protein FlgK [Clostridium neuense]|uniref:Flagellar hook-associated protein 1 n=1 Tax=Clostridium neuense TaxID=1728934 RepID=A0ABW8TH26_9CLOT
MSGLFATLDTSSLGLTAQQAALNVTSHNIANASTPGYTRQRADLQAVYDSEVPKNQSEGRGVIVSDIERIKDAFIDYQVRNQTSNEGTNKSISNYLGELQNIMNEPSGSGMGSLISTFFSNWHDLSQSAQTETTRGLIVSQTKTLTDQLNSTYKKLQDLKANCNNEIDNDVFNINSTLDKIDSLNAQIIDVKASGGEPNDLMDTRDTLLNTLSEYFNINVDSKKMNGIELTASNGSQLSGKTLVQIENGDKETRFSYINNIQEVKNPDGTLKKDSFGKQIYDITYYKYGDKTTDKNKVDVYVSGISSDQLNELSRNRVLWADKDGNAIGLSVDKNGKSLSKGGNSDNPISFDSSSMFTPTDGILKGTSSVQTDIDKYTDYLNKIAKAIALSVNAVESGSTTASVPTTDASGKITKSGDAMPFFVNGDKASYTTDADNKNQLSNLSDTLSAESGITAGNISINKEIYDHPMEIKTRLHDNEYAKESDNPVDGNTDGVRAQAVADLANKLLNVQGISADTTRDDFFNASKVNQQFGGLDVNKVPTVQDYSGGSTVYDYLTDAVTKLGTEASAANTTFKTSKQQLQALQQSRDSVSGVSLDEEMTNLIQYNHAYQANAKVISTVNELLDVVINGLMK